MSINNRSPKSSTCVYINRMPVIMIMVLTFEISMWPTYCALYIDCEFDIGLFVASNVSPKSSTSGYIIMSTICSTLEHQIVYTLSINNISPKSVTCIYVSHVSVIMIMMRTLVINRCPKYSILFIDCEYYIGLRRVMYFLEMFDFGNISLCLRNVPLWNIN